MTDIDPERVLSMNINWSGCPVVTRSIGMLSGQWRVKNTRIPVDALVTNYNSGYAADDLRKMFPNLTDDIANEIIRYAYDRLPKRQPAKS